MRFDFSQLDCIYDAGRTSVYRGATLEDGTPIVLKTLRHAFPSPRVLRALRNEHRLLSEISVEGVAKTYGLREQDGRLVLLIEDFGGVSLAEACRQRRFTIDTFFDVAIPLALAVAHVHQAGIIHKDISPGNVVWNPSTSRAKLIDFGISARASRDLASPVARELQGTLAYISPEQTGRTHRHIDWRSDLYSLGCTLYESLLGHPPFEGTDAAELVHAHLAVAPRPPHELDPQIPETLSRILCKLLEKNAEDRYQSAFGLAADLIRVRDARGVGRAPDDFVLGRDDVLHRFRVPDRLYGRTRETEWLLERFAESVAGRASFCVVSGYSGIGKTSLVEAVQAAVAPRRGAFLSGKFDQFKRGVPYASLLEACEQFTRQLLAQPAEITARWRDRILDATAPNTQVLLDVIPDLLPLLGEQPALPELPPAESENRLNIALGRFLRSLAEPERPLVLFLDDLQWADLSSLHLVERLVTDARSTHLMVIGAYRENEVGDAHPLRRVLDRLAAGDHAAAQLHLGPLSLEDAQELIGDAQRQTPATVRELAELCMEKTGGNPFFLNQFIEGLHDRGLLRFDLAVGQWTWDLDEIRREDFTDNVVEFMTAKVRRLEPSAREALMVGSVIGNSFEVGLLAGLLSHDASIDPSSHEDATLHGLDAARREGLVYLEFGDVVTARFLHDRVQQAAYELLGEERRRAVHHAIGLLLWDAYKAGRADVLFDATNHLNAAIDELVAPAERLAVARLNLDAATGARNSAAYVAAKRHAQAGLSLLPSSPFQNEYRLAVDLHVEAADAAFLTGDYATMETYVGAVLASARDVFDEVRVHEVRVNARNAQNDLLGAVQSGLAALERLGIALPTQPSQGTVMGQLVRTKLALRGKTLASIAALPDANDRRTIIAARLIMNLIGPAYYASPNLLPIAAFQAVRLTLEHGLCAESATGFALYGLVLSTLGDLEGAYEYGQVAMAIADRFDGSRHASRARHLYNTHIRIWKEPWHRSADALLSSHERAYANGDFEYAAFSGFMRCALLGASGRDLDEVTDQMERTAAALHEMQQTTSSLTLGIVRQAALNLRGVPNGGDPWRLVGEAYDERVIVQQHRDASDTTNLFCYLTTRMRLAYLFGRYAEALEAAEEAAPIEAGATSTYFVPDALFYESLTRIRMEPQLAPGPRLRSRARLMLLERRLAKMAVAGPMNIMPRLDIIRGERHRFAGRNGSAIEAFDRAARTARENGSTDLEALALELAGELQVSLGNSLMAPTYLRAARYAYERWGAHRKARQLIDAYPFAAAQAFVESGSITGGSTGTRDAGVAIDLEAATRASRAISEEIVLPRLLERMMKIVVENAGAERGVLVLVGALEPRIAAAFAVAGTDGDEVDGEAGKGLPLVGSTRVAEGIVRLVLVTGRPVVLEDATRRGEFTRDPYVLARHPKSILCVPIEHQGSVKGVLYLENNLARGAFTNDRIEMLQLLAAQAAVSIENAQLYDELDAKVRERTRQLEARNEFIRKTFGRYLSDDVVDSILDAPHGLELGGELRVVTVVIADLRGFSTAASRLRPEEVLQIVNNYLEIMTDVIFEYGGTIDEVLGDGLLVLFGAPVTRDDDADRAVACAIAMQRAMSRVNDRNRGLGLPELEMGIGIHTGEAVVGNIGSDKRAKYGVVGTVVNLAARIESLSTGGQVLISGATRDALAVGIVVTTERSFEPKGAPAPMTVLQVRSVSAPFDLSLPEEDLELVPVASFDVVFARIADGAASAPEAGRVLELSRNAMVIEAPLPLMLLTDLRIDLPGLGGEPIYGKVVDLLAANRFVVRFTAVPESARVTLGARSHATVPLDSAG